MGEINKLAEAVNAPVIGADVTSMDDLKKLFEEAQALWRQD
jgi:enoyl-[acyl-carrier protein] reductase I